MGSSQSSEVDPADLHVRGIMLIETNLNGDDDQMRQSPTPTALVTRSGVLSSIVFGTLA